MDNVDAILGVHGSGDNAPVTEAPQHGEVLLKREQDSTDDFEHLEGDKQEAGESPLHQPRAASQNFLEMEREEFAEATRVPSVAEKLADHLADKFTDSESDADTAGESPMHRPDPLRPSVPEPPALSVDPTPVLAPAPATPIMLVSSPPPELPKPQAPEPAKPDPKPEPVQKPAAPPAQKPEPARAPTAHIIEAEVIFCQMGLDAWFDPQRLHPEVESLIYWRDPVRSGAAVGGGLALLVALAWCSAVSVAAHGALLALLAATALRVYRTVLQAVQKTNEGHPFKWLLDADISLPADRAQALAAAATAHLNAAAHELRRLFLVEDLVDSLKFGVLLWCLTYVGACFNGITLIILAWVALFSLPKAYELNKAQVDANLELARAKINEISAKVRAAVPLGRKAESDKEK